MDAPVSGDIFPAVEAIGMIDAVDLTPPIEVPPVSPDAYPENVPEEEHRWLESEIRRLKKERNAYILAHNYAPSDIQDVADAVGDSLYLAQKGAAVRRRHSSGSVGAVHESDSRDHEESRTSGCWRRTWARFARWPPMLTRRKFVSGSENTAAGIVISYVNTYLDVKAESDYCCASANAAKVILHVLANSDPGQPILFLPDVYLGFYAAKLLEQQNQSLERLWLMMGACHVHDRIRPYHVEVQRRNYPDAAVVVHPECGCTSACMRQMAQGMTPAHMMQFRSTQGMAQFVRETPQQVVIMATEVGNIYPLSKAAPGKTIVPASPEAVCAYMKQNTLRKLYVSLRDGIHEITVDPDLGRPRAYSHRAHA